MEWNVKSETMMYKWSNVVNVKKSQNYVRCTYETENDLLQVLKDGKIRVNQQYCTWNSNDVYHMIQFSRAKWRSILFLKKNVHVNRMILCNRKPHPNCLNEFADEIKSTRRKQIFSLVNAYERKKIEFQVGVCPFYCYALFTGYFKLIRV